MPQIKWSWSHAFRDSDLTSTEKLVLHTLSTYMAPDGGHCYPSLTVIADKASLNQRTVERTIISLEGKGWIERVKRFDVIKQVYQSTLYRPLWGTGLEPGTGPEYIGVPVSDRSNRPVSNRPLVIREDVDNSAWEDYVQHRKELKKTLTKLSAAKQQGFLAKHTAEDQREIVEQSIRNGWTGLFPLKGNGNGKPANSRPKSKMQRAIDSAKRANQ